MYGDRSRSEIEDAVGFLKEYGTTNEKTWEMLKMMYPGNDEYIEKERLWQEGR